MREVRWAILGKKRLLKPKTVLKKWAALVKECKPKSPGSRKAKETAALAGMKSMGEVRCAADMTDRGISWKYENEVLEYQHDIQKYTPDFTLYEDDDTLIEYKGKMTGETRKKLLSIKRCNPKRKICLVFEQHKNKLSSRKNSQRYWEWAEKNGFPWSSQTVDEEWLS